MSVPLWIAMTTPVYGRGWRGRARSTETGEVVDCAHVHWLRGRAVDCGAKMTRKLNARRS